MRFLHSHKQSCFPQHLVSLFVSVCLLFTCSSGCITERRLHFLCSFLFLYCVSFLCALPSLFHRSSESVPRLPLPTPRTFSAISWTAKTMRSVWSARRPLDSRTFSLLALPRSSGSLKRWEDWNASCFQVNTQNTTYCLHFTFPVWTLRYHLTSLASISLVLRRIGTRIANETLCQIFVSSSQPKPCHCFCPSIGFIDRTCTYASA